MGMHDRSRMREVCGYLASFSRRCIFRSLSMGPIPSHLAFIMDGNRRFAKKENLETGAGHKAGFTALMLMLKYCYELGVKYVTVYAFSIDNFKRRPDEVQIIMDMMLEKSEGLLREESVAHQYGMRVYFIGNLKLLDEPNRIAAKKVMMATANYTNCVLLVCVAYTSYDEITHAVEESCKNKLHKIESGNGLIKEVVGQNGNGVRFEEDEAEALCRSDEIESNCKIQLPDVEKHIYMSVVPDPDILIRTSGETRLSNFLLWQAGNCKLYSPDALWPEIGLKHLVWAVLNFQRNNSYLEKKKKKHL
ncbi:dehydrodolichyl diphosphate synthase 6-like [Mercurialis annua]|uniref:dehydrodolichyl diphosphate synthase 6-like n=1 Tax=Mercurialis annua TaxID=3986 RepID=UPI00215F5FF2|nr:dehydrodolichyl diphosphate synthase 6-like [Mercurialis annua]